MTNAARITTPGASDDGKSIVYNLAQDRWDLADVVTAAEAVSGYQPLDADLTAIAALTTTAFGRSLLAAANAAALRTLAGTVIGTDVASQTALDDHLNDTTDAHDASAISFSATGTIAGTDVQTAVAEVATDAATALSTHEADTTSVHGITDTSALVTLTGSQTLTNKTITSPVLTLTQSTSAAPTVDGRIEWDSDDNKLKVGDGSGTVTISGDGFNAATYQPLDSDLTSIAALTTTSFGRALLELADAAALRTAGGLGTIATQAASNVTITGGSITGITDLPVADGGTGASNASGARTNLGLVIGTDVASQTSLDNHLNDSSDAHDASAISVADSGTNYTATDVEGVLAEIASQLGGGSGVTYYDDVEPGSPSEGETWYQPSTLKLFVYDSDATEFVEVGGGAGVADLDDLSDVVITAAASGDILRHDGSNWVDTPGTTHYEVAGAVAAHTGDTSDAHDASAISVADSGGNYTATDVEGVLAEIAPQLGGGGASDLDDLSDVTITAAASGDILRHNGTAWVDTPGTTHFEAAGAVATHEADTTSVHGISDTANLVTLAGSQTLTNKSIDAAQLTGTVAAARLTRAILSSVLAGGRLAQTASPIEWQKNQSLLADPVTYYTRVVGGHTTTAANVRLRIGVASGNISVAVYGGGSAAPSGSRLATTGAIACPSAGNVSVAFSGGNTDVATGDWLAVSADNSTVTFGVAGNAPGGLADDFGTSMQYREVVHPAPATVGTVAAHWNAAFILMATT